MLARAALTFAAAALCLAPLAGCAADTTDAVADDEDGAATSADALSGCTKKMYVHVIAYGATDYATIHEGKNACWGMAAPKWSGGLKWSECRWDLAAPTGGDRWVYDDVNLGASGHADETKTQACRKANGGAPGIAYVAANSGGGGWWHEGMTGVSRFFNECYDSDFAVNNRLSGCSSNGIPMWNIGASKSVYKDVLALCKSRPGGAWMGIYAASVGLKGKEAEIVKALNDCTTK